MRMKSVLRTSSIRLWPEFNWLKIASGSQRS
jgi:hypothetical protein